MFGQLGLPEMLVIMVIALLIFGPKKLPSLGKSLGEGITSFKKAITHGEKDAEVEEDKEEKEKKEDDSAA
jgi:sec-independent protein translocase protein TatA